MWGERNPEYYDIPKMFAPCNFWLTDQQGNIIVDDVVKLEEIDSHWSRISSKTGINEALERHNQTVSSSSEAALSMNEHSRKVIVSAFEIDFQAFGYEP